MSLATRPRLSPAEVLRFRDEGYLIYDRPVLAEPEFLGLKTFFEELLDDLDAETRPESMDVPHFTYPKLLEWVLSDPMMDLVEPIIGPDIALFSTHFICKPKGDGRRVPWHEDSAYWSGKLDPMDVCTIWLAIDPSKKENGCMRVIPHTHRTGKMGFSDYDPVDPSQNVFSTEIIKGQRDDDRQVLIELEPNQASLHDAKLIHGSEANTSNVRRCGLTMRFIPTTVRFDHEKNGDIHQIYFGRGQDHAGNVYADPSKSYPELARFRSSKVKNSH
jgi:hypothetical protein